MLLKKLCDGGNCWWLPGIGSAVWHPARAEAFEKQLICSNAVFWWHLKVMWQPRALQQHGGKNIALDETQK